MPDDETRAGRERDQGLETSEREAFREILRFLDDVVFIHDGQGNITYMSPAAETMMGYSQADAVGMNFAAVIDPEFLPEAVRRTEMQIRGEPVEQPWNLRAVAKDGSRKWIQIRTRPVYGDDGRLLKVIGVARDIRRQKELEEEIRKHAVGLEAIVDERTRTLRESEERYRALVDNSMTGIVIAEQGRFLYANRAFGEMLGYGPEEIASMNPLDLVDLPDRETYVARLRESILGGKPVFFESRIRRKDGEPLQVEIRAARIMLHGRPAILGNIADLTERRRMEEQVQRVRNLEMIGTLAGGVAHDFNNLLMGIQGRIDLIRMDAFGSAQIAEHVAEMEEIVSSAAELTKQLLGFAGKDLTHPELIDVNEAVEKTARLFGRTHKELTLNLRLMRPLWAVRADRSKIEQVLLNLCMNAGLAMSGSGELLIETANVHPADLPPETPRGNQGMHVMFSVADSGVGMDDATMKHLFEPFFTKRDVGKGSGLGLASSWGIVKRHGGFITVRSSVGAGSTFRVYIPALEAEPVREKRVTSGMLHGSGTLLVVDDEEAILLVASLILKRMGFEVLKARSGEEAVEIFGREQGRISAVLLDFVMPGMNGRETATRLRAIDPGARILIVSGFMSRESADELGSIPCDGVLKKPYDIGRLSDALKKVLRP